MPCRVLGTWFWVSVGNIAHIGEVNDFSVKLGVEIQVWKNILPFWAFSLFLLEKNF